MKNKALNILFAGLLGLAGLVCSTVGVLKNSSSKDSEAALAWSGNQTPNIGNYYNQITDSMTGATLQSKLKEINPTMNRSYDWSRYKAADEAEGTTNQVISIYTRHNINKNNTVSGSYSWDLWNREHIWTQTAYPNSAQDNHNIFACEGKINQIRGNYPYAEVPHNSSTLQIVFDHDTGCYFYNSTFEPNDAAKGEVARAVMYGVVIYDYTMTQMISYETVLKWHLEHPVTNRDIYRNNTVHSLQGNRNPFVDHPEYACRIWGDKNATTRQLCGSTPTPATTVTLDKTSASIAEGESVQITATSSNGSAISWTKSNDNVNLSATNGNTITVTAKSVQEQASTIVTATNAEGATASCIITITKQTAPLAVNKTSINLEIGSSDELIAITSDQSKITFEFDAIGYKILNFVKLETSSGDPLKITGLANGTSTITVKGNNESISVTVVVGDGKYVPEEKSKDGKGFKLSTPAIIGISAGGGAVLIAGIVVLIVLLVKKKPV